MKFRTKIQEVDAVPVADLLRNAVVRWDNLPTWVHDIYESDGLVLGNGNVIVRTDPYGWKEGQAGDWVLRSDKGEVCVVNSYAFEATFESVDTPGLGKDELLFLEAAKSCHGEDIFERATKELRRGCHAAAALARAVCSNENKP